MGVWVMTDSTIRINQDTKRKLCKLDFVGKEHSYNQIVDDLIEFYHKKRKIN